MLNRAASFALLLTLFLLATHTWFGPDVWYHLAWGRQILAQGTTRPALPTLISCLNVTNQYWLFQLALTRVFALGGVRLVSLVFALTWVAIGAIWLRLARGGGVLVGLAFLALVQLRLEYRPETFSFLFLSLTLLALSEPRGRWRAPLLIVTQILWVNVHGYFVLGPALTAASWAVRRDLRHAGLTLGAALATLINPGGYLAYASVFVMSDVLRRLGGVIEELTPTWRYAWWYWPMPVFWLFVAGLGALAARHRRAPWPALVACAGLVLGVRAFRFIPLMLILSAPLVGAAAIRVPRAACAGVLVLLSAVSVAIVRGDAHRWLGSGTTFGWGLEWAEYPIGAAQFLRARDFRGRVFNAPNDGGYFEYHLRDATVATDSSYVDAGAVAAYFAAAGDPRAFAAFDQTYHFDAAVVPVTNEVMVEALLAAPVWAPVYADSHRIVFMKNQRAIDLRAAPHRHGEDPRRFGYAEAAAAWDRLLARLGAG